MQFQEWKALAMLANPDREWQTRRVAKEGEYPGVSTDGWILHVHCPGGRIKWQVGHTYAIQTGRGKRAVGRFELLNIQKEPLQDISNEDIKAEGIDSWPNTLGYFDDRRLFARMWDSINKRKGTRWEDNPDVWVLTMRVVKEAS